MGRALQWFGLGLIFLTLNLLTVGAQNSTEVEKNDVGLPITCEVVSERSVILLALFKY
jgi:hypothetical protein